DRLLEVEVAQSREVVAFGDHQLCEARELAVADQLPPTPQRLADHVGHLALTLTKAIGNGIEAIKQGVADEAVEDCLLVGEVAVDRARRDAGALGDLLDAGFCKALLDKQLK